MNGPLSLAEELAADYREEDLMTWEEFRAELAAERSAGSG